MHHRYSDPAKPGTARAGNAGTGLIDAELVRSLLPTPDADYYFCGPRDFRIAVHRDLVAAGTPPAQMHFEFFGPREDLQKEAAALAA